MKRETRTLVQCDFDGTVTEEDVSFLLLDAFASGDWKHLLRQYQEGKITVGQFNREAFAMVTADKQTLRRVKDEVKVRTGFHELVAFCRRRGFRLVIVSNGLDFYIGEILKDIGLGDIEAFAAKTEFRPDGLKVQYIGPDGGLVDVGFKDAYVKFFLSQGYRIIYIGNGVSDVSPARQCHYIFATGALRTKCEEARLGCIPFTDFNDVVRVLEGL